MSDAESQPDDDEICECDVCGRTFFSHAVMLMHLTRAHQEEVLRRPDLLWDRGREAP